MKVYIPKYSGFCPGVKLAEKKLFEKKKTGRKISVLGELIHNQQYIGFLEREGIGICGSPEEFEKGSVAVIRTHGIEKQVEEGLRKGLEVLDLTCGKVKQLQKTVGDHSRKGYAVVITGKRDHPEMLGLVSYAAKCTVIENDAELKHYVNSLKKGKNRILLVSQTTGSRSLFEKASTEIKAALGPDDEVKTIDSICSVNTLREKEAVELQKNSEITVVIGDRISSNANKLYEILKKSGEKTGQETVFVSSLEELLKKGMKLEKFRSALVVSSSSTPEFVEKELVDYLLKTGGE